MAPNRLTTQWVYWRFYYLGVCNFIILVSMIFVYKRWEDSTVPLYRTALFQNKEVPEQTLSVIWSPEGSSLAVVTIGTLFGAVTWNGIIGMYIKYTLGKQQVQKPVPPFHPLAYLIYYFTHGVFVGLLGWFMMHAAGLRHLPDLLMGFMTTVLGYAGTGAIGVLLDGNQGLVASESTETHVTQMLIRTLVPILYGISVLMTFLPCIFSFAAMDQFNTADHATVYVWVILQFVLGAVFHSPGTLRVVAGFIGRSDKVHAVWTKNPTNILVLQSTVLLAMILVAYILINVILKTGWV